MIKKILKWSAISFGVLLCLALLASASGGATGASGGQARGGRQLQARMGEAFQLGEFTYIVTAAKAMPAIGNQFARQNASNGATFVAVVYTERNDGNSTHRGFSSPFELRDDRGRAFSPSSRGETAMMMALGRGDLLAELHPGVEREAVTVFEIPKTATGLTLAARERGVFGAGEILVPVVLQ